MIDSVAISREEIRLTVEYFPDFFRVKNMRPPGAFVIHRRHSGALDDPSRKSTEADQPVSVLDSPYIANRFLTQPRTSHVLVVSELYNFLVSADNGGGVTIHDAYSGMTAR